MSHRAETVMIVIGTITGSPSFEECLEHGESQATMLILTGGRELLTSSILAEVSARLGTSCLERVNVFHPWKMAMTKLKQWSWRLPLLLRRDMMLGEYY